MSTTASQARGTVPTRMAAGIAALALLAMPMPAGAHGQTRTVLLTLTDGTSLSQLADNVTALGGQVLNTLEIADSLLVELPKGAALPAGSAEIPDTPMRVNGAQQKYYDTDVPTYRETIGAPDPESAVGRDVTVALIDTGVSNTADGLDEVEHLEVDPELPPGDGLGHGTFLAGIIGGRGDFPGVAPSATLVDVQVADASGDTSLYLVLAGIDAVVDRGGVDVVNISLSTDSPLPPSFDPLSRALERLWVDEGITVVTAAGNDGPNAGSVSSPGNDPILLTVGALDEVANDDRSDDKVAAFSSWDKSSASKPDLVAPGVSLVSTLAPGSIAEDATEWTSDDGSYMRGSGTSMSAAVVTGAVAAVLGENVNFEPNGIKALLTSTAYDVKGKGAGAGALDLHKALQMAAESDPDPAQVQPAAKPGKWGPNEDDADAWAAFSDAWEENFGAEEGDKAALKAVQDAWENLSWRTQQWAARSWSFAVMAASLGLSKEDFEARSWSARSWSLDAWLARSWSARSWSARSWSFEEWLARSWSARSWSARSWSARSWSADEWLARSWSARSWSDVDWAARSWSARSWSARSWSARSWSARSWSDDDWAARSWSARSWSARSWSDEEWAARSWSDEEWAARSWSARSWSARSWSARSWSMTA